MVGNDAHGYVDAVVFAVFLARDIGNLVDQRGEHVGIVVRLFALKGHAQALEAHACVDDAGGQRLESAVGLAVILHEHEVPDLDNQRIVFVDKACAVGFGAFGLGTQVYMDLAAGAAGARVTHLPEIIVLVAVDDMGLRQMFLPDSGSLVVAADVVGRRALEHGCIKAVGVEAETVDEIFPGPIDSLLLEIVAERPVAEHLEHRVVVGVHANLFEVVVLATDTQTLLAVSNPAGFGHGIAENNILELVHAGIGEHQSWVILDHHRSRRNDFVAFLAEKLFERLADLFCC